MTTGVYIHSRNGLHYSYVYEFKCSKGLAFWKALVNDGTTATDLSSVFDIDTMDPGHTIEQRVLIELMVEIDKLEV